MSDQPSPLHDITKLDTAISAASAWTRGAEYLDVGCERARLTMKIIQTRILQEFAGPFQLFNLRISGCWLQAIGNREAAVPP